MHEQSPEAEQASNNEITRDEWRKIRNWSGAAAVALFVVGVAFEMFSTTDVDNGINTVAEAGTFVGAIAFSSSVLLSIQAALMLRLGSFNEEQNV